MGLEIQQAEMALQDAKGRAADKVIKTVAKAVLAKAIGGAKTGNTVQDATIDPNNPQISTNSYDKITGSSNVDNMIDYNNPKLLTGGDSMNPNYPESPSGLLPTLPSKQLQAEMKAQNSLANAVESKQRRKRNYTNWKKKYEEMQKIADELLNYGAELERKVK